MKKDLTSFAAIIDAFIKGTDKLIIQGMLEMISSEHRGTLETLAKRLANLKEEQRKIEEQMNLLRQDTQQKTSIVQEKVRLKEEELTEIAQEIKNLEQQKEQQEVQLKSVQQQATELKRQIAESSFYHAVFKSTVNKEKTREKIVCIAYQWMVEEAARSEDSLKK